MKKASFLLVCLALLALSLAFFGQPAPVAPATEKTEAVSANPQPPAVFQTPARTVVETVAHPDSPVLQAQVFGGSGISGVIAFLAQYWQKFVTALVAFAVFMEVIVRLTPTEKDNAWFAWFKKFLDRVVPNNKVGGGTHP